MRTGVELRVLLDNETLKNTSGTSLQVNMNRYTIEQRLEIIRIYYQNACSVRRTYRALREIYGQRNRPTERSIYRLVEKFGQTGSLANKSTHVHRRGAQPEVNIAAVRQSVRDDPNLSIPRRSQELGLSQTTTWIILHQDLHLKAYKVQITQKLKANAHHLRRNFANWVLERVVANWVFRMHSYKTITMKLVCLYRGRFPAKPFITRECLVLKLKFELRSRDSRTRYCAGTPTSAELKIKWIQVCTVTPGFHGNTTSSDSNVHSSPFSPTAEELREISLAAITLRVCIYIM
ncbi:hypothetical protein NQ317_000369 [Molorchus minor]|uniref:DUF4817 domain-containing protein n=1 Tax=Molorchus minor TaxID=1323400 RepID=A0ABQ9JPG7_9CUCU|nr:hypothetical protein NQ317_000369 [Molorchus minor]